MAEAAESYVKYLLTELQTPNAAILEIIQTGYTKDTIIALVEGDDDVIFYHDHLKSELPDNDILIIDCKNKNNVIEALEFLESDHSPIAVKAIIAICDKDFDDFGDNIKHNISVYYTDLYSIENYIITTSVIKYIFEKFSEHPRRVSVSDWVTEIFIDAYRRAAIKFSALSAYACLARKAGSSCDFDAVSISDFSEVQTTNVTRKVGTVRVLLEKTEDNAFHVDMKKIAHLARKFRKLDPNVWLRGRQALQLARIIASMIRLPGKSGSAFSQKMCGFFSKEGLRHFGHKAILPEFASYVQNRLKT